MLKGAGWAVLAILLAPLALLALMILGTRELVARVRGDFRPVIPPSPLDDPNFEDAQAAATAFVDTLKAAVPDATDTVPNPDHWPPAERDDTTLPHGAALTSPRLNGEQVLVTWQAPQGDLVRVEFPPLIGTYDWYVGDAVSEGYWAAHGLLSHGVRYAPNRAARNRAWVPVPQAGGWTTLGVTEPKGSFEPDWHEHAARVD
ncbi:MAG: hypothetical protein AAGC63_02220 [Propionicimonas sp.]|nr:hypothetical protein [Propionicimonas sp.]